MTATLPPPEVRNLPELLEPSAWVSLNVLTQKATVGSMPITALQPGVYQNTKVFSEDQMRTYALAAIAAKEAEVGRLRIDADRYRWLRGWGVAVERGGQIYTEDALDILVDGNIRVDAALTQGETK